MEFHRVIREIAIKYDKLYTIVIFGSRYRGDNREDSDIDLAVFSDYDIFQLHSIGEEIGKCLNIEVDISDICDLDDYLQQEILESSNNILYQKDGYEANWNNQVDYIVQEINFKRSIRD